MIHLMGIQFRKLSSKHSCFRQFGRGTSLHIYYKQIRNRSVIKVRVPVKICVWANSQVKETQVSAPWLTLGVETYANPYEC